MIWFRSANSHTGPQLHRCIRGRTDGSIRLRANLLQKPLGLPQSLVDDSDLHRKGFTTPVLLGRVYRFLRFPLRGAASAFIPPPSIGPLSLLTF